MIKFVLLDLDDTLFDCHAAEHAALRATLTEMGVPSGDGIIELYSRINAEHWKMLERGEMTREEILTGRFDALYREIGHRYGIDIVASGGVSSLEDVKALRAMDLYAAIIGKAYYTGAIDLAEALEVAK